MKKILKTLPLLLILLVAFLLAGCKSDAPVQQTQAAIQSIAETTASVKPDVPSVATVESSEEISETETEAEESQIVISEDGSYTSKEEVALYLHTYGHLPDNYITKTQAKKRGWEQTEGNLRDVLPGMSIGGGPFGNNEGLLPEADGREYYECDIDYDGGKRNAKRIIYSNDGLIYYTEDHYNSFEQLY